MKQPNRWLYAVVGVIVLIFAGLVYAWTVLQAPIAAMYPSWTKSQMSLTFTITMGAFCIGGFLAGKAQKSFSCRMLVWLSAALFLAGFLLASKAESLLMLYLGFGILAGAASGISYNAVMSSVSAWFPDKPGLVSGLLLMGFGMSSFLVGKIYTAVTPSDGSAAWRTSFLVFGILLCVVMLLAGFFVKKPDSSFAPPAKAQGKAKAASFEEVSTGEMLRRGTFWRFILWATFLTVAGLAIISQGTPMALEACPELAMSSVATIVGLISVCNGIGRILFGGLYDKLGHRKTMLFGGALFLAAMLLLLAALKSHSEFVLIIAYITTGLAYGCVTPTNSAFVGQFFGRENYPSNFSIVNMNILVASFGSTAAGAVYDKTQSYTAIIFIVIALIVVGTLMSCTIKAPDNTLNS